LKSLLLGFLLEMGGVAVSWYTRYPNDWVRITRKKCDRLQVKSHSGADFLLLIYLLLLYVGNYQQKNLLNVDLRNY